MTDGKVTILVDDNAQKASLNFNRLNKSLTSTKSSAVATANSFSTLKKVVAGVSLGLLIRQLFQISKELRNAASDAEETASKFDAIFKTIGNEADLAAEKLAESFGLASSSSKELLSNVADLLTGIGFAEKEALKLSDATVRLGIDLASFTNFAGGAKGSVLALTKALLGERESLKSLNRSISEAEVKEELLRQGKQNLTGLSLQQAKAEATLAVAYRKSANVVGDFARTQDSAANVQRRYEESIQGLAEELGDELLPAFKGFQLAVIDFIENDADEIIVVFDKLEDGARILGGTLKATIGILDGLGNGLSNIKNIIDDAIFRTGLDIFDEDRIAEQAKASETLISGIDTVVQGFKDLLFGEQKVKEETNVLNDVLKNTGENFDEFGNTTVDASNNFNKAADNVKNLKESLENLAIQGKTSGEEWQTAVNNFVSESGRVSEAQNAVDLATLSTKNSFSGLKKALIESGIDTFADEISSGITEPLAEGESAADRFKNVFKNVAKSVIKDLIAISIRALATRAILGFITGGASEATGTGGAATAALTSASAKGNIFHSGKVKKFADGGIVDGTTVVPSAMMGEAGPEGILPLKRDKNGKLGVIAETGNNPINVNIINNAGAEIRTQRNSNGDFDVIVSAVRNVLNSGRVDNAFAETNNRSRGRGITAR